MHDYGSYSALNPGLKFTNAVFQTIPPGTSWSAGSPLRETGGGQRAPRGAGPPLPRKLYQAVTCFCPHAGIGSIQACRNKERNLSPGTIMKLFAVGSIAIERGDLKDRKKNQGPKAQRAAMGGGPDKPPPFTAACSAATDRASDCRPAMAWGSDSWPSSKCRDCR